MSSFAVRAARAPPQGIRSRLDPIHNTKETEHGDVEIDLRVPSVRG